MPSRKPTSIRSQLSRSLNVLLGESDEALIAKVKNGEIGAFETLFERYKKPIMSYAFHMTGKLAIAEEITQEVFLKVYKHASTYEKNAKFTTWLWTIAHNLSVDHFRKKTEVLLTPTESSADPIEDMESPLNHAESLMIERTTQAHLSQCMEELTGAQCEALSLRTFGEVSYDQIAATMKLTLSSVKSLIFRAKQALVECMQRKGGENE